MAIGDGFEDDDDPFADAPAGGSLELDLPPPKSAPSSAAPAAPAPQSEPEPEPEPAPEAAAPPPPPPPPPPDPAAIIARYPPPPSSLMLAPLYAAQVVWRQLDLRQQLDALRRRRSPDVPLFERALQTYEPRAFSVGLTVNGVVLAILVILFFMPVILRFTRD